MRRIILGLSNGINAVVRRVTIFAVALMFVAVMIQVIARYVFSSPPVWTEDVARYAMVWTGLLGASLSFKSRSDAVLMQSVFPSRPHLLGLLADALQTVAILTFILPVLYFCFFDLRGGMARSYLARQAGITMDTLGIPMVWISVVVPVSFIIILIHLAARWAEGHSRHDQTELTAALD